MSDASIQKKLVCRYKAGLVSFEYYNTHNTIVSVMLRRVKANCIWNRFNDLVADLRKLWPVLNDLDNNGCS